MEENLKNKLGFWLFFLVVFALAVGGYFLKDYLLLDNNFFSKVTDKVINKSIKIEDDKDYIYFINELVISDEAEIFYKEAVINIKGQENLTKRLQKETAKYKENIKYISKLEIPINDDIIKYNYDDLYALNFLEQKVYESNKYISLVIDKYNYSCFDLTTFVDTSSYVFEAESGKLIEEADLLKEYNLTKEEIVSKIKTKLNSSQQVIDEVELIKINETIDDLKYSLFVNNYGKLMVSFLVKTTQVDYNEVMEA